MYVTNVQVVINSRLNAISVDFTDAWTRVRFPLWAIGVIAAGGLLLIVIVAFIIHRCRKPRHGYKNLDSQ